MLYNLTGILSSEEKVEKLTVPYEHETVSNGLDSYKILDKSDLTLTCLLYTSPSPRDCS